MTVWKLKRRWLNSTGEVITKTFKDVSGVAALEDAFNLSRVLSTRLLRSSSEYAAQRKGACILHNEAGTRMKYAKKQTWGQKRKENEEQKKKKREEGKKKRATQKLTSPGCLDEPMPQASTEQTCPCLVKPYTVPRPNSYCH
jgi:hypothetical protein